MCSVLVKHLKIFSGTNTLRHKSSNSLPPKITVDDSSSSEQVPSCYMRAKDEDYKPF
jgi:hypothetical protein